MAKFREGDKVKVKAAPVNWPACTKFPFLGATGTVETWVDWPEVMDPYSEYVFVKMDKGTKGYEGVHLIFHDLTLKKI
jgi:hypothetical protein